MPPAPKCAIAYVSFDVVPGHKGAATHIQAFAQALARRFGTIDLVTVSPDGDAARPVETWPGVIHHQLPAIGKSLIDRVLCFRLYLSRWLASREFDLIQFRSIFEGMPLLNLRGRSRLIFEVNGLPSIELKYRYPGMVDDRELMRKLIAQEAACLNAADGIVTPSAVTAKFLTCSRGAVPAKVHVIANGVDLDLFHPAAESVSGGTIRLVYFGTLAPWQGVELGIRALAQIHAHMEASLTIIGTGTGRQRNALAALAAKLGVSGRVSVLPPMSQSDLATHLRASDAILVPLTLNDRNTVQGCCPLKVLEGMATGTPVIATDLPVVRELGNDGEHFLLVKPGSVDHIAETILRLHSFPALRARIAQQAPSHVAANFTWQHAGDALIRAYERLLCL